jgi:hypothetical protein
METSKQASKINRSDNSVSKLSFSANIVKFSIPKRKHPLQLRVTAPLNGLDLPIIVFAHGFGSSMLGYDPLVEFWASQGFVVIQPTFLDSKTLLGIPEATHTDAINAFLNNPESALIWRQRVDDMILTIDRLNTIEEMVPAIYGRMDHSRIAAAGHSFGAHTVGLLLGARVIGPDGELEEDFSDRRIKAGVLLSAGGRGGDALSDFAKAHFSYLNQSSISLVTQTLVVAGDHDFSPLSVIGPEWFTDAYFLSPGANALLTLFGGEHMLGGITGYQAEETTDENPERVDVVKTTTCAYLRTALFPNDPAWVLKKTHLEQENKSCKIETKSNGHYTRL